MEVGKKFFIWVFVCISFLSLVSMASAAVDKILCVPWQGNAALPHTAISNEAVNLYAVIYGDEFGGTFAFTWDFKDGTTPASGNITIPPNGIYNLQVTHTFAGVINAPFDTELTIGGITDVYKIILAPANNDSRVNIAIDKALWYLHRQMVRTNVGSPSVRGGYWNDAGNYYVGRTGACVWAFEVQGHLLNLEADPLNPVEDPYVEDVQRGINYLLTRLYYQSMNPQSCGHPEAGQTSPNGYGLVCYYSGGHTNYENGLAIGAIAGCGTPNATAATGNNTYVLGRPYKAIVQDMVDWYAWSQIEGSAFPPSGARGGWYYTAGNNWAPGGYYGDNSASQWAYIGLDAAEANFGCTVPVWVKQQLAGYLHCQISYEGRGFVSYRAGGGDFYTGNVCLTGGALVGMALVGETIYNSACGAGAYAADLNRAELFLGNNWHGTGSRWTENWYGHRAYYTMYAVMKGLRLQGITSLPGSPGTADWYADYVSVMTQAGEQYSDGHFRGTGWMDGYIREDMGTAFGVLILTPSVFSPPPVACFEAEPNPGYLDVPITFDPSCSYHSDGTRELVRYEWDWNNDGIYDVSTDTPDIQSYTWDLATYPLGTYPVTLRVTDNTTPEPVTDTYVIDIDLTTPPHPPVADVGGPYTVSLCPSDILILDGSQSKDIDEGQSQTGNPPFDTIISWNWDLNGSPWDYNQAFEEIASIDPAAFFSAGTHTIGLRVSDNTAEAFPESGQSNLTDEDFGEVTVHNGCVCDLSFEIGCQSIILQWSVPGTYEVLRSTSGSNTGFTKIGEVTGTGYTDLAVDSGTTYYYRLKGVSPDCMSVCVEVAYEDDFTKCLCIDNLSARAKVRYSVGKVQLVWTHQGDADCYNIYRSTSPHFDVKAIAPLATCHVTTYATYLDSAVVVGNTYYYKVTKLVNGREVCISNEIGVSL